MIDDLVVNAAICVLMVAAAIWTVVTVRLLRAAIGLAVTSALLTVVMYRFGSPLAAAFELSVCAGLISVIFVSAITLTSRLSSERMNQRESEVLRRFWFLPLLVIIAGVILYKTSIPIEIVVAGEKTAAQDDVRAIIWNTRHLDLIGQIAILLAGAIGVVLLFKERKHG
jgi:NADH-quinone oxidoreductase subunit J